MKISTRLVLGFACTGALMALMAGLFIGQTYATRTQFGVITGDRMPKLMTLQQIKADSSNVARALLGLFVLTDSTQIRAQYERIKAASVSTDQALGVLRKSITDGEGQAALARLLAAHAAYAVPRDELVKRVRGDRMIEAKTLLFEVLEPTQQAYIAAVDELVKQQADQMEVATRDVEAASRQALLRTLTLLGLALAIAAMVAVGIIRSITRPLKRAVDVAQSVASGNLSMAFDARGNSETAQLLLALKAMQESLVEVVSNVRQNAERLAVASTQIAQGNNDLSSRTEHQAGALQQTASSMEELSATVRQTADRARAANNLAFDASNVAIQGGEAVGRVVETMQGIDESSHRIAEVLGVIDSIAFQTNILALNAAVEAARAGQHGRGFAVVASEVRSLAHRSADAAQEIKTLIGTSVERVGQGTLLVNEAGATMQRVVASIQRVTQIVTEISTASSEQSRGVVQVAQTVGQMDQVTQQNAALVEESAVSAALLRDQAQNLVKAVAVFKLGSSGSSAAIGIGKGDSRQRLCLER
ncbi:HAMP domain-containing protein [Noviherbaspirillum saxi]|uniref:HAMP domain-containing protein n=2 Tax=Noviherbaspirillum saxi TaxID=2320863 RepID=A0A3A3FHZ5_9BURK|nr:HAMP domain-containing protein [Noviherbaspirillum saxi]